jgi:hypothetical protein
MHPHMAYDIDECVEHSTLPEKITTIIPTAAGPLECLLWSVFSLLLRARPDDLIEHFMVVINGPDERTGDPTLQDKKQAFLEELRDMKWYHADRPEISKDMPITVIRAWSRIGHPEAVEMALPWVHTDAYHLMHDDIIINKHGWLDEVRDKFYSNPNVAIAYSPRLHCCQCNSATYQNKHLFRVPHLLCAFLVCRKKWIVKTGQSWCGYHIPTPTFELKDRVGDVPGLMRYYSQQKLLDNPPQTEEPYDYCSMEMGAWLYYHLVQQGRSFVALDPEIYSHFGTMSWESETGKNSRILGGLKGIKLLESEIEKHPTYKPLYDKYIKMSQYYQHIVI